MKNSTEPGVRPKRADALRNRDRVLAAAKAAFEADGVSVPLDEVARRAGVGPGTVHRHFPTKDALLEAIVQGTVDRLVADARRSARGPDAFYRFFTRVVEQGSRNRAFTAALGRESAGGSADELFAVLADLLTHAQADGAVRADVDVRHVKASLVGVLAACEWLGGRGKDRRRLVDLTCDAFRPRPPQPLPALPPLPQALVAETLTAETLTAETLTAETLTAGPLGAAPLAAVHTLPA